MPSKNVHRFSCFAGEHSFKLIESLAEKGHVGKGGLLEVLVLGMEANGVDPAQFLEAGVARRKEVNPDGRRNRADIMAQLAKLPRDQLAKVFEQATGQKAPE
jgi:hypothetical protein